MDKDTIKVLPVFPEFPDTFWSFRNSMRYVGKKAIMTPTGLLTVMAMLTEEFEAQRLIDLNVEPLTDKDLENADLIFTSSMIVQEESHNEIVKRAHQWGKKVVAGGPFPTTHPDRTGADSNVTGEAEVTLGPFLRDYLDGATEGIWTEKNVEKGLVELTKGGKVPLKYTPLPRWDLIDLGNYYAAAVQFSRGCPFNCDFCDITKLYGKESRTKTPHQMIEEFNALHDLKYRGEIFIVDDNFIGNRKNVRKLLPEIAKWQEKNNYPFTFFTEASMDLAWDKNKDILEGMVKAGLNHVFLGIESDNMEDLRKMQKMQNTNMPPVKAVRTIQQAGLEVSGGFIVGTDGQKKPTLRNLYEFIQEAGIPVSMTGLLMALKGTDLYNRLEKEGRIREDAIGNNTHQLGFNFEPKTELSEEELLDGYKGLLSKLFNAKNYFKRCRTLQENRGPHHITKKSALEGLLILGKSIKGQLFAKGGLEYAKYLIWTAWNKPSCFSEAVALAIKFDHFKKITDATLEASEYVPLIQETYERFIDTAKTIYAQRGEVYEKLGKISERAQKVISKEEKRFGKLHKDFRQEAEIALKKLKQNINTTVNEYETRAA